MPCLTEIRCVYDSFAVRRKIRPRLPRSFLIMYFARFSAQFRLHAPETTRPIDVAAVRNENQFRPVRRPGWTDLVIKLTVVIARQITSIFSGKPLCIFEFAIAELANEDVEMSLVGCRDESDTLSIRRDARFNVDRSARCELLCFFAIKIQCPQFDRVLGIGGINDPMPVRRAIGLIIVASSRGQLFGNR